MYLFIYLHYKLDQWNRVVSICEIKNQRLLSEPFIYLSCFLFVWELIRVLCMISCYWMLIFLFNVRFVWGNGGFCRKNSTWIEFSCKKSWRSRFIHFSLYMLFFSIISFDFSFNFIATGVATSTHHTQDYLFLLNHTQAYLYIYIYMEETGGEPRLRSWLTFENHEKFLFKPRLGILKTSETFTEPLLYII